MFNNVITITTPALHRVRVLDSTNSTIFTEKTRPLVSSKSKSKSSIDDTDGSTMVVVTIVPSVVVVSSRWCGLVVDIIKSKKFFLFI